jgi:hypothetical protein
MAENNIHPRPTYKVDPQLQRAINEATVDFINDLCQKLPRISPFLVAGVRVAVATDKGGVSFEVYIPGNQASPIIPIAKMPDNLPPISGHR